MPFVFRRTATRLALGGLLALLVALAGIGALPVLRTSGFCTAVDNGGHALTTASATTDQRWTTRTIDPGNVVWDVSCPSPEECVAGDSFGKVIYAS